MGFRKTILLLLLALTVSRVSPTAAQETLTFSGIKGSINHEIGEAILKEAYANIDINIKTVTFPAKRALIMSNSGEFDGEVQRIDNMNIQYPNLVKVPEPILYLESSAFVKGSDIRIEDWNSLKPYRIGIPRGIKYLEQHTKGLNRVFVKSHEQLFYLLEHGRIDVVIIATNYGQAFLKKNKNMDIKMQKPPIIRLPLYHYLYRKHQSLIPMITESIRNMKDNGMIDIIIDRVSKEN